MNKENIKVTLSLAEFDKLRESEQKIKGSEKKVLALRKKLENCITFDWAEYDKECIEIDNNENLRTDKQIEKAMIKAESKIKILVDTDKLKSMIIDLNLAGVNISKSATPIIDFK